MTLFNDQACLKLMMPEGCGTLDSSGGQASGEKDNEYFQ
jgi:hypothetical protein